MRKIRIALFMTAVLLTLCVILLPANAHAAGITAEGTYGEDLSWQLTEDGTLTISGTGPIDCKTVTDTPWHMYYESITSVVIEDGITAIGDYAFSYYHNLEKVSIGDGVTSIGSCAFNYCYNLSEINIPNSVTSIGGSAFLFCKLTEIVIPEGVTRIEDSTFWTCGNLTEITIPVSVSYIGDGAFYGCESLRKVMYAGSKEQWNAISIGDNYRLTVATVYYDAFDNPHTGEAFPMGGWLVTCLVSGAGVVCMGMMRKKKSL